MKRSTDRILTTHVGSLIRPPDVLEGILTKVSGQPRDEAAFNEMVRKGVQENVRMQAEVGIDIPSDGEVGKPSFAGYITERLGGLEATVEAPKSADNPMNYPILNEEFPGFMAQYNAMYRTIWMPPLDPTRPGGRGRRAHPQRARDRRRQDHLPGPGGDPARPGGLQGGARRASSSRRRSSRPPRPPAATKTRSRSTRASRRTSTPSPMRCARSTKRSSTPASSSSWTSACRPGIRYCPAIHARPGRSSARASEMQVEAYNHALQGIPEDRVRYHLCWGSMNTPAHQRHPAEGDRRSDPQDQRPGVLDRGGQPAPRARVDGLEGRQAARTARS